MLLPRTERNQTLRNLHNLRRNPLRTNATNRAFISKLVNRGRRNGWRILGQGVNGTVFNNGNKARKFMLYSNRSEYNLINNLVRHGVNYVPKVHTLNLHPNYTMFSMNKIKNGTTLYKYLLTHPGEANKAKRMKTKLAMNLHNRGISHGDLHDNNVMVELNPNGTIKKMWIIDFGRWVKIPHGKTEQEAYRNLGRLPNRGYGSEYGSKPSCTDKRRCQMPNFRVGHTTRNALGRKVYLGNNGRRFRMNNGRKVLVPNERNEATRMNISPTRARRSTPKNEAINMNINKNSRHLMNIDPVRRPTMRNLSIRANRLPGVHRSTRPTPRTERATPTPHRNRTSPAPNKSRLSRLVNYVKSFRKKPSPPRGSPSPPPRPRRRV